MKIQEIKNTLGPHQRETLVLRKGDVGGTVHFTVPDLTGITSADFRLIKPDGTFVVKSGAIVQNTVIVQITEQMCTVYGSGIYNLELKASGVSVYTAIGRCLIDKNIDLNDYAASVAEVNGLVFPDDFLTSADLSDYVTETELETAISNIHTPINFSTAEQNTGLKWVDGKTIYQKTHHFIEASATVEKDYDISSDNVDFMISCVGCIKFGSTNKWYTVPRLSGGNYIAMISANNHEITVGAREYTYTEAYATIQYTKTTDTV